MKGFTQIAKPLHQLVTECGQGKGKSKGTLSGHWTPSCQDAFDQLKEALTTSPVLWFTDYSLPYVLETDASHDGLGTVRYRKERVDLLHMPAVDYMEPNVICRNTVARSWRCLP